METGSNIQGEVVVNIPFTFEDDGFIHAKLTLEQFTLINKYMMAHQKQLNACALSMAKKKNTEVKQRTKLRYNLLLTNNSTNNTK
jgi:hypothetical protein